MYVLFSFNSYRNLYLSFDTAYYASFNPNHGLKFGKIEKLWSIYVPYLSPTPNERVEMESKDIVFKKPLKYP